MNLAKLLESTAERFPSQTAVKVGDRIYLTYSQLANRVKILAGRLVEEFGLKSGDRVALVMKNTPQYIELLYAVWHAGLAVVPMNAKLHARELEFIIEHSGARVCFSSPVLMHAIKNPSARIEKLTHVIEVGGDTYLSLLQGSPIPIKAVLPTDLAWLFYTSGTTGQPKGAALSHRNLMAMTMNYLLSIDTISPGDGILHAAPMSHGSGLYIMAHTSRGGVQIIPRSGGFDECEIFDLLPTAQGVTMFAAPTMIKRLGEHPEARKADTRNLKTIVYGGGPMYLQDLLQAQKIFGYKFAQIYGQGESPMTITGMDKAMHKKLTENGDMERLNSAGLPQFSVAVTIVDNNNKEVERGMIGEIAVRGDTVMTGYWNDAEATAKTIQNRWLLTGDVGKMDDQGYVTLTDRSKDVIISGGANIYPREVEEVFHKHPKVSEVSIVGKPDPQWGELIVAFVVGSDLSAKELDAFCLENIARFKRPKEYRFLNELPKNNYGKVLKTELREILLQSDSDPG